MNQSISDIFYGNNYGFQKLLSKKSKLKQPKDILSNIEN